MDSPYDLESFVLISCESYELIFPKSQSMVENFLEDILPLHQLTILILNHDIFKSFML